MVAGTFQEFPWRAKLCRRSFHCVALWCDKPSRNCNPWEEVDVESELRAVIGKQMISFANSGEITCAEKASPATRSWDCQGWKKTLIRRDSMP